MSCVCQFSLFRVNIVSILDESVSTRDYGRRGDTQPQTSTVSRLGEMRVWPPVFGSGRPPTAGRMSAGLQDLRNAAIAAAGAAHRVPAWGRRTASVPELFRRRDLSDAGSISFAAANGAMAEPARQGSLPSAWTGKCKGRARPVYRRPQRAAKTTARAPARGGPTCPKTGPDIMLVLDGRMGKDRQEEIYAGAGGQQVQKG